MSNELNYYPGITAALARLQKELRNIILNTSESETQHNGIAYHYTSAAIVSQILHTNDDMLCLRFTDYRFLNDKSEGQEIQTFLEETLNDMLITQEITKDFYDEAYRQMSDNLNPRSDFYVACLSENKDSLPMWNYYLKDGKYEGYSLGFDFSFQEYLNEPILCKRKIIYEDSEKKKVIRRLILEAIEEKEIPIDNVERCKKLMTSIQELSLVMKKSCFSHEKEVRLILNYNLAKQKSSGEFEETADKIVFHCGDVDYHNKNGIFIPHCDIKWKPKNLLKEICYAPTMNEKQTELGLKSMLSSMGYNVSKIDITPSEIPVRY